ncbi:MAG: hypothetical protein AB1758_07480 [Candidatus Eremiobacterota bacterium]
MLLYELVETEDSLEVGSCVGEVYADADGVEIRVADPQLEARLAQLMERPLTRRGPAPHTLGTAEIPVKPGEEGYLEALAERLRKRDFRLHLAPPG